MNYLLHTPEGVRDIYDEECRTKNALCDNMSRILRLYGYQDIQTPTFEYFDIFNHDKGTVSSKNMYKFIDRDGSTLVLRPDITPSIARAAAKYFNDETMPLRFSYCGNTFINNSSLQGKMKETTQLGVELIGDRSIDADAEMIVLAVRLLESSGLENFQLDIGHVGFFKALASEAGLDQERMQDLRLLIESKNYFGVESFVEKLDIPASLSSLLLKLPELFGTSDVLSQARNMTDNPRALQILRYLDKLYEIIRLYGCDKYITIDLGMLSEYDYYTGIIFRGYTYGTGDAIVKGGRYDRLLVQFGKDAPSIGCAVVIDELMLALSRQKIAQRPVIRPVLIAYRPDLREAAFRLADMLRGIDRPAIMFVMEEQLEDDHLIAYAIRRDMPEIYIPQDQSIYKKIDPVTGKMTFMPLPEFY